MAAGSVIILGAGPAGLFAAAAVEAMGSEPVIMSRPGADGTPLRSEFKGAQYLHAPIYGITGPIADGIIKTVRVGKPETYAYKVYGREDAPTSWSAQQEERPAWDLRRAYDTAWAKYRDRIVPAEIGREEVEDLLRTFDLVISTIWAPSLCRVPNLMYGASPHEFNWGRMYVAPITPLDLEDNTIVYSGRYDDQWYRTSRVFGHVSTEATAHCFDGEREPLYADAMTGVTRVVPLQPGVKVVGTNCDCWPELRRAGRFGTWRKGYLTHHAFEDALKHYTDAFGAG